jgi:hypothetical protein
MATRALLLATILALAPAPALAGESPKAILVHCGADTCLRLSGHRVRATVAVRIDGHTLAVEGARAWRVTVPLSTARSWRIARGDTLAVTLADDDAGTEHIETAILPPGSLGSRLELASLEVRAH